MNHSHTRSCKKCTAEKVLLSKRDNNIRIFIDVGPIPSSLGSGRNYTARLLVSVFVPEVPFVANLKVPK